MARGGAGRAGTLHYLTAAGGGGCRRLSATGGDWPRLAGAVRARAAGRAHNRLITYQQHIS